MKMRVNAESVVLKNVYFVSTVLILVSCFIGCTAGSCLSYGHSCWGAHGKRSGYARGILNPERGMIAAAAVPPPPIADERYLLNRLLGRQSPLTARLRSRPIIVEDLPPIILPVLEDESNVSLMPLKRSLASEKLFRDAEVRSVPKAEQKMTEGESSDILLSPQSKDLLNDDDQAIKMGLYKILRTLDEKLK